MKTSLIAGWMMIAMLTVAPVRADEDTPLAKAMEGVNDAYKALKTEKDAAKGAELARKAQDGLLKSLSFVPKKFDSMPQGEKAKAGATYRAMVAEAYVTFCKIEVAFLSNKLDEIAKLVDHAKTQKGEGHDMFIED